MSSRTAWVTWHDLVSKTKVKTKIQKPQGNNHILQRLKTGCCNSKSKASYTEVPLLCVIATSTFALWMKCSGETPEGHSLVSYGFLSWSWKGGVGVP